MSSLICTECLQVPFVEFLPGLMVKFSCHEKNMIRHIDLDKIIENLFTLKCPKKNCQKKSNDFHVLLSHIICNECLGYVKDINKKRNYYIQSDSLLKKCKSHYKKYSYYDQESHCFFCENCDIPKTSKTFNEYANEFQIEKMNILDKLVDSKNDMVFPKYYEQLIKRIIETYKNYGKTQKFNAYYNTLNAINFISNYSILAPFCQKCKEIIHMNILENINNKPKEGNDDSIEGKSEYTLEVSCQCSKLNYYSIKDFENKMNSNTCDNCNNPFTQTDLIYDAIFDQFFCQNCARQKLSLDYIRFNEFIYICWIHKKSFDYYCNKCGKLFCSECKNLNNHKIVKLNNEMNKEYPDFLNKTDWFIKIKNHGLLNLEYDKEDCKIVSENIIKELEQLIKTVEKEKNKSFANKKKMEQNSSLIIQNLSAIELYISNTNLSTKILDLENKNNQLILSSETILKELNQKNELVNLVSTRNILQHLIINIIKKNYLKFENIKEDFRILYESYNYLNYEFINEKNKLAKSNIEKQLKEIISKFIELIKYSIKKKVIKIFIERLKDINKVKNLNLDKNLIKTLDKADNIKNHFDIIMNKARPKISESDKLQIFNNVFENEIKNKIDMEKFSVIKDYNKFLLNQSLISDKKKFNEIQILVDSLEKNDIPEMFERKGFTKFVNITGIMYNDKYGYINEKSIDSNFIKELLKNSQEKENYQYLFLKEDGQKDFLKSVKCKNDMEFYFLYMLIENIIKRIGNIVHQNDKDFKIVFKDISNDLNRRKYKLVQDINEKNGYKFIEEKTEHDIKTIKLTNSLIKLNDFNNFANNFYNSYIPKLKILLGEQDINKIRDKIEKELNSFNVKKKILNNIEKISNVQKEGILFYNNYKDLLVLFPLIKEYLSFKIDEIDDLELPIKNIDVKYSNEIKNNEFTKLVNYFVDNYLLIIYIETVIKNKMEEYNKQCDKFEKLLDNNVNYELSKIILESYQKKIKENNLVDIFNQEKEKLIDIFTKMKMKLSTDEEKNSKNKEDLKNLKEQEINKYNSLIEEMKNIDIEFVDTKFEEYLKDIDTDSFAYSKFDVILYLYQNDYI